MAPACCVSGLCDLQACAAGAGHHLCRMLVCSERYQATGHSSGCPGSHQTVFSSITWGKYLMGMLQWSAEWHCCSETKALSNQVEGKGVLVFKIKLSF